MQTSHYSNIKDVLLSKEYSQMKKAITLLLFLPLFIIHSGYAQQAGIIRDFKGFVTDGKTAEPLPAASISLVSLNDPSKKVFTFSGLNGSFVVKNLQAGDYNLKISYVGYISDSLEISLTSSSDSSVHVALQQGELNSGAEVVVYGRRYSSEEVSYLADKNADIIQNSLSQRAIEISPDLSVANTAQRISGVSLERSTNGEGQYVIIRGMDKRYIYTLVNGIKIPSPDNKNRYVPLDIFPNDLLERLEVRKSLTSDMEGDAIGGSVNMVMKDAPSKFAVTANIGTGYAGKFFNQDFMEFGHYPSHSQSPRMAYGSRYLASMKDFPDNMFSHTSKADPIAAQGNFTLGGRLFNHKLGVLLGGSYLSDYRNVNSLFFEQNTEGGDAQISSEEKRDYSIRQQRTGLEGKLDYDIDANNKIALFGMYTSLLKSEYKYTADTSLTFGRTAPGTGRVEMAYKDVYEKQQIANVTLTGNHIIARNFIINWIGAYSKATLNRPDEGTLNSNNSVSYDSTSGKYSDTQEKLENSTREFTHSIDEDKSGYLNLTYKSLLGSVHINWSAGGMYRNKTRRSNYDEYDLNPDATGTNLYYDSYITNHTFTVADSSGTPTHGLNYDATEDVGAAYAMATIDWGDLYIAGGARYENTHFTWQNFVDPTKAAGHNGNIKYYDLLPSASIKYSLTEKNALRFSYYSAISRPNFYEVVPHIIQEAEDDYAEEGNPYLKHSMSSNFDLKYEHYFTGIDQILAGVFYKKIKNPIEYALTNNGNLGDTTSGGSSNGTFLYYTAQNFGNAANYGFELDLTKYWRWFGVRANYTFTDSKITTTKVQGVSDPSLVEETRPLQGQAKHIANLSLLYKDDNKIGLNAQLAFNYTSRRINTVSAYYDQDIWQKGFAQLDFSVEKRIVKHWFVYVKASNIFNTPYELEMLQGYTGAGLTQPVPHQVIGKNIFIRKDTYGANYLIGIKFNL